MEKIQLTVTIEQAQAIADSLDLYSRLSIGQVCMIPEMVAAQKIPMHSQNGARERMVTADECAAVRDKLEQVARILGYDGLGHSLGISNEHVPIAGHRAWEVSRVLEKVLSEHRNPAPTFRGVNYDGLKLRYTRDPLPECAVIKTE